MSAKKTLSQSTKPTKKTAAKKSVRKTSSARKTAVSKKAVTTPKKTATAKPAVKKKVTKQAKKVATKKRPATKKTQTKATVSKQNAKAASATQPSPAPEIEDPKAKALVLGARKRTGTPAVFKTGSRKSTPIVFTLEDVQEILRKKPAAQTEEKPVTAPPVAPPRKQLAVKEEIPDTPRENRVLGAASIMDILGFNPADKSAGKEKEATVPRKWQKYYRELIALRDHVRDELDLHTRETLKRSSKDDSSDLSGYGQHTADAGTDTFDRDFALSLVSSEQEALYEINEAIQRILKNTYGICEITGQPIAKERLMAVPFTRYSLEGQRELEKTKKRTRSRTETGVFGDTEDAAGFASDDDSDS